MQININIRKKGYAGSWVTAIMVCTKAHGINFTFS